MTFAQLKQFLANTKAWKPEDQSFIDEVRRYLYPSAMSPAQLAASTKQAGAGSPHRAISSLKNAQLKSALHQIASPPVATSEALSPGAQRFKDVLDVYQKRPEDMTEEQRRVFVDSLLKMADLSNLAVVPGEGESVASGLIAPVETQVVG